MLVLAKWILIVLVQNTQVHRSFLFLSFSFCPIGALEVFKSKVEVHHFKGEKCISDYMRQV